jgi:hypothetical protein
MGDDTPMSADLDGLGLQAGLAEQIGKVGDGQGNLRGESVMDERQPAPFRAGAQGAGGSNGYVNMDGTRMHSYHRRIARSGLFRRQAYGEAL